jgi:transcriptional regulator with XRE-family HTH domain
MSLSSGEITHIISAMVIGERLRQLREQRKLSQGDMEERTGLLRCYTSRVENGHTVPMLETLEKYARTLDIPVYRLFYEGDKPLAARADRARQFRSP